MLLSIYNSYNTKSFKVITNNSVMLFYLSIVAMYVLMLLLWTLFDDVTTTNAETMEGEEFEVCASPKTSLIGYIYNYIYFVKN